METQAAGLHHGKGTPMDPMDDHPKDSPKLTARQQYRLAREWCRFNRLPEMLAPRPCYHVEPPADKKELADANSANASAIDKITSNLDALELRLRKQDPTANIDIRKLLLDHGLSLVEPGGDEPSSPGLEE